MPIISWHYLFIKQQFLFSSLKLVLLDWMCAKRTFKNLYVFPIIPLFVFFRYAIIDLKNPDLAFQLVKTVLGSTFFLILSMTNGEPLYKQTSLALDKEFALPFFLCCVTVISILSLIKNEKWNSWINVKTFLKWDYTVNHGSFKNNHQNIQFDLCPQSTNIVHSLLPRVMMRSFIGPKKMQHVKRNRAHSTGRESEFLFRMFSKLD